MNSALPTPPDSPKSPDDSYSIGNQTPLPCSTTTSIRSPRNKTVSFEIPVPEDLPIDYSTSSEKPPFSYSALIIMALKSNRGNKMSLSEICKFVRDKFKYYRTAESTWKNSVRHNLSINQCFKKISRTRDEKGKGAYWQLDPDYEFELTEHGLKRVKPVMNFDHQPKKQKIRTMQQDIVLPTLSLTPTILTLPVQMPMFTILSALAPHSVPKLKMPISRTVPKVIPKTKPKRCRNSRNNIKKKSIAEIPAVTQINVPVSNNDERLKRLEMDLIKAGMVAEQTYSDSNLSLYQSSPITLVEQSQQRGE
jgi:hypothetical protein